MRWLLVAIIVAATVASDVIQSLETKRHGELSDFRPGRVARWVRTLLARRCLLVAVFFLAVSFFAFMTLLSIADLSFAVPATAATFVLETVLAKFYLKERVTWKRWAGAGLVASGVALLAL